MATMSTHPLQMVSADTFSSFIPFCAFDGHLSSDEGMQVGNVSFCNSFYPTITPGGQLCYALNKTKIGVFEEAFFLIDPNTERSLHIVGQISEEKKLPLKLKAGSSQESLLANVYIDTLESFTSETNASYALTSLKKMTSTSNFDEMSDQDKGCIMKARNVCQREAFLKKMTEVCQCVPFGLWPAWPNTSNEKQVRKSD